MKIFVVLLPALLLAAPALAAGASEILVSADQVREAIHNLPKTPPTNRELIVEEHYVVKVARVENRNGPFELHRDQDRVFYVLEGKATMRTGGKLIDPKQLSISEWRADSADGYRELPLKAGSVLSVPRGVAYQIVAAGTDVKFLVVAIR
jgi:mannose-6-phosphate isomerase-like protein (cupin superfamily)